MLAQEINAAPGRCFAFATTRTYKHRQFQDATAPRGSFNFCKRRLAERLQVSGGSAAVTVSTYRPSAAGPRHRASPCYPPPLLQLLLAHLSAQPVQQT